MTRYHTPLRYPGGKQKLTPFVDELLQANHLVGCDYVEPYAGGAGVAMQLLLQGRVGHVHLNDSSPAVYALWKSMLTKTEEFCRHISMASLTVEEWRKRRDIVRNPRGHTQLELGFSAFYLNRCNRSGVLSGGLIGGLQQEGDWKMDARFSRLELIRRIEVIAERRASITLRNLDAETFIAEYVPGLPRETLVYCDPPYFKQGSRLYDNYYDEDDHKRIAGVIQHQLRHRWIVSYDNAPEIREYYKRRRSFVYDLQYNASRVYKGREVFIFSDDIRLPAESALQSIHEVLQRMPRGRKACSPA